MSEPPAELPIFTKSYDFVAWLVPLSNHFPRAHRQTVTRRLLDAALDFLECLVDANGVRGSARLALLRRADQQLDRVRFYMRLAHEWRWINPGQYEHAARQIAELGRLLGGWQRVTRQKLPPGAPDMAPDGG